MKYYTLLLYLKMATTDIVNRTMENKTLDYHDNYEAYFIAENVQKYSKPIICLCGFIGNFLSAVIFLGKSQRKTSCSLYLCARSLSDTGFLISLFFIWLGDMKVNAFKAPGMCQLIVFLSYVCSFLSVWFIVIVTFENYIRICLPFQVSIYCTTRKANVITLLFIVLSVLLYSFTIWTTAAKITDTGMSMCEPFTEYVDLFQYFLYVDMVITLVLPTLITITLMLPITFSLVEALRRQARLTGKTSSRRNDRRHTNPQSKVTKLLFCVSLAFIILSLPSHIIRLQLTVSTFVEQITTPIDTVTSTLKYIFESVYYCSFSINIFIYLSFGDKFRSDFKAMFCMNTVAGREQSTQTILTQNITRRINREESHTLLGKEECETDV